MPGKVIALVGCVKSKRSGRHAAQDLYTSTLFKYSRAFAEQNADLWFILSAKYGLVEPGELVESYEQTLKWVSKATKERWAADVKSRIQDFGLNKQDNSVIWLASRDYKFPLATLLACSQSDPMEGKQLGLRLSWLKKETSRASKVD